MSGRPRTACRRCNTHKVRCSGHHPVCHRCERAGRPCIYDPSHTGLRSLNSGATSQPARASRPDPFSPQITESRVSSYGVPVKLMYELVNIYFSHMINSTLLLHQPTFFHQLSQNSVGEHIILSICAIASKFHLDESGKRPLLEQGFTYEWAAKAGRLVFEEVHYPQDENVVTFINLALFWYGEGQWRKSAVYQANGLLITRLSGVPSSRGENSNLVSSEVQCRRFWACFLIVAFGPEIHLKRDFTESARELNLPCAEEDFELNSVNRGVASMSSLHDGSVQGEFLRVITFWNRVSLLVQSPYSNFPSRLAAIHELGSEVSAWRAELPVSLELSNARTPPQEQNTLPLIFLIHIVYHQSLCSLHASIVPLFCWHSSTEKCPTARQISAQIAFQHACSISELANRILSPAYELSRTPSFVGYACYCACAVQIPFLSSSNSSLKEKMRQHVVTNLKLLREVGKYWKFISLLSVNIQTIYDMHRSRPCIAEDEPKNMDAQKLNDFKMDAPRITSSILNHNNILRGPTGSIVQSDADVTNLGPGTTRDRQTLPNEETVEVLITGLSRLHEQNTEAQNASAEDHFQPTFMAQDFPSQLHLETINGGPFFFPCSGEFVFGDFESDTCYHPQV